VPGADWTLAQGYSAKLRFGQWDDVLVEPRPSATLPAATGGYLYARGVALAAKGRLDESKAMLAELEKFNDSLPADASAGSNSAKDLLAVAIDVLKARIAGAEQRNDDAVGLLQDAVAREDKLAYSEPDDWFYPVRHLLGAELLKVHKAAEAEAVYREDLVRHPENGWSLFGLAQALRAQNKTAAAGEAEQRFKTAWKRADVTLTASAM
jgi:tetratricopeptide (TPR) repeat protein